MVKNCCCMMDRRCAIMVNFLAFAVSSTSGMGCVDPCLVCSFSDSEHMLTSDCCSVRLGSALKAIVSFAPAELSHDHLGLNTIGVLYTCFAVKPMSLFCPQNFL